MKNLQSIEENKWFEVVNIQPTEEEKTILSSTQESDSAAKEALITELKSKSQKAPKKADLDLAKSKYSIIKNIFKDEPTYELISVNVFIGESVSGILNCRVKGEHKQIRF